MENQSGMALKSHKITGIKDEQEFEYWWKEFGISKDELLKTVNAGGTSTEALEKYVKKMQLAG